MQSGPAFFFAALTLWLTSSVGVAQSGFGRALLFDGGDDQVTAVVPSLPTGNAPYTIEAWVKPETMTPGGIVVWGNTSPRQLNSLRLTATGFENSWSGTHVLSAVTGSLTDTWHHLAATYDGTTRRLYLDGVQVASDTPATHNVTTTGNFTIGKDSSSYFNGAVDNLRIWNSARSAGQIQTNRWRQLASSEPGLVANFEFDEVAGTLTRDATTNRFRGSLVNRPRRVPSFWWPVPLLNGPNPLTNAYAVPFTDPGVTIPGGAIAVAIGEHHSTALKNDGTVVAWGYNPAGETTVPPNATNLIALVCGSAYNLALRRDGSLVAWGDSDAFGQTTIPSAATNIVAIAAGTWHNLSLTAGGNLVGWGRNVEGQLDFPPGATNLVAIAAGAYHGLGLRSDGTVIAWGTNYWGEATVPASATNVIALEAGYFHSLALRADGTVVAWGLNTYGQTSVPVGATNVVAIDANSYRSVAVRADGTMLSWGGYYVSDNTYAATVTNVLMASSGWEHMLAVRRDGTILGWGSTVYLQTTIPTNVNRLDVPVVVNGSVDVNSFGPYLLTYNITNQLGATGTTNRLVQVLPPRPEVVTLSATGTTNSVATLRATVNPRGAATTTWFEWGFTTGYGSNTPPVAVGNGTTVVPVNFFGTNFSPGVVIHYRAVADNGSGIVSGADQSFWVPQILASSLAPLTNECHTPFIHPALSVRGNPLAIAANGLWSVGLQADGRIVAWGNNTYGQININTASDNTNFTAVDAGMNHGLALRADGTVRCWGRNDYGQTNVPPGATNVVAIAAGDHFNLALRADGSMIGWGLNTYGQATAPAAATNVVAISAGNTHSLALRADGSVVAWGDNYSFATFVPASATNIIAISAGAFSLALRADRTVLAWGDNYYGQLNVPAQATNIIAISAGWQHGGAVRADGAVFAWGRNDLGETNVPAGATNVIAISAGPDHNVAMRADGSIFGWGYGAYGQTASFSPTILNLPVTTSGLVDENVPGTYSLTYLVTNFAGGVATAGRTVTVTDTLPPMPSLLGENPLVLAVGETFIDPGAVATDLCGGDVSAGVVASGFVNTAVPGSYVRTYTATDAFGNAAAVQRTFIVGLPTATTLAPNIIGSSSALLKGQANPRGVSATAWFEWGLSTSYGNQTPPVSVGTGVVAVPVNTALAGLNPSLVYHYRLVVSNSVGNCRGLDQVLWWPELRLNSAAQLTNECHVSYTDTTTVNSRPAAITAGAWHNFLLKPDGSLVGWGDNSFGQRNVPADGTNFVAVIASEAHSLGLKPDGTVLAWGLNNSGQTNVPAGLSNVVAISAEGMFSLALRANGTVVGWGDNTGGQTSVPADLLRVAAIAAGGSHGLALRDDATVIAWGSNAYGQTSIPAGLINVVAISAGNINSYALKSDGTVVGWGSNDYGQNTIPNAATNVTAIAAGGLHCLALRADGSVIAWGYNASGQANVPATVTNIIAISAGAHHSLALRADGAVIAWGNNSTGQTSVPGGLTALNLPVFVTGPVDANTPGTYTPTYQVTNTLGATATTNRTVIVTDSLRPTLTMPGANPLILAVGAAFTDPGATATDLCAGSLTASIVTTGSVDMNVPGSYTRTYTVTDPAGNITQTNRAVLVGFPQANTFSASNLLNQSALLSGVVNPRGADTTAWFEWGTTIAYTGGQFPVMVGNGTGSVPVSATIAGLNPGVLYHSRLVASNAVGISRGENRMFWLPGLRPNGLATVTNQCHVAYADAGARQTALVAVAGGNNHSVLLRADGRVFSWGYQAQTNTPTSATNVVAIAGGGYVSLALRRDGSVLAWGQSTYGETSVPAAATNLVAIAAGGYDCLALRADGTPVGWGNNYYGQPTVPTSATNGIAIACGHWHNLLVRRDGTVIAWGNNEYGQTNVPAAATNVVAVVGGEYHSLALRADGRVIAWGQNTSGQTNVPASATNIIALASGAAHNLALRADGRILAWGRNSSGQTNIPTAATNIIAIGAGVSHSLAVRADGAVFGWGLNSYGQANTNGLIPLNLSIATVNSVDANTPGSYAVNYAVTNLFGAVATTNRTVLVTDTLPPVLTLLGMNPVMLLVGSPFTEPGATATDLCAGDLSGGIIFGGGVDQNIPGSYLRTYTVTDSSGNLRATNRTVVVVTVPELGGQQTNSGAFKLSFTNTPGARFNVLATTNLLLPSASWTVLGPVVEVSPGQFEFGDPAATNWLQRFYRVKWP